MKNKTFCSIGFALTAINAVAFVFFNGKLTSSFILYVPFCIVVIICLVAINKLSRYKRILGSEDMKEFTKQIKVNSN